MSEVNTPFELRGIQFPFRATGPQDQLRVNALVSRELGNVDNMIYQLVRQRVRGLVDDATVQEIVQECRQWLWQKSLPKYDAHRVPFVKISTFINTCARNFIKQEIRRLTRRRISKKRTTTIDPEIMLQGLHAPDTRLDERVQAVAEDVLAHPEKYLTAAQVEVFKKIIANPTMLMKDVATELDYQRASSLSMMLRRIRERLCEIDLEEHESEPSRAS